MNFARRAKVRGEGGLSLFIIVLLLVGGIVGWLYWSRRDAEKNIRVFAAEVARRVAVDYDDKFLRLHLSSQGQIQYLSSWRDRLFEQMRVLGVPAQPIEMDGNVEFDSHFFHPRGNFRALLKYPATEAELDLGISRGMVAWQVDTIGLIWTPPPTPTPGPTPVMTPTPTPAAKSRKKQKG